MKIHSILEEARVTLDECEKRLQHDFKGTKREGLKAKLKKNTFFMDKRKKLGDIHIILDQTRENSLFILQLIKVSKEFDPTNVISDQEGRHFWQTSFHNVCRVPCASVPGAPFWPTSTWPWKRSRWRPAPRTGV